MNIKSLYFLITLAIVILTSCDGRYRAHKSNEDVLRDSKLLNAFSKQIRFVPNTPIEISTDTILTNGFHIKLRYSSLENSYASKTEKTINNSVINTNYKNFKAVCKITKDNKVITQRIIDKSLFYNLGTTSFWEHAVMQFVWVDYNTISTDNYIRLNTSFCIPETDTCKDFTLFINEYGDIKIEEINLIANTI